LELLCLAKSFTLVCHDFIPLQLSHESALGIFKFVDDESSLGRVLNPRETEVDK